MSTTTKRKQRPHGVLPAGFKWREGRPRWEPAPGLRKAGWRGANLVDDRGDFLTKGDAIEMAERIAAGVDSWRAGHIVPAALRAMAPAGACDDGLTIPTTKDPLAIGPLIDAWFESKEFKKKAAGTQRDYRGKIKRLVDTLAGFATLPAKDDDKAQAAYTHAVAAVRATSILALEPSEDQRGVLVDLLYDAYWKLHDVAGIAMAYGVLATAGSWLSWVRERKSRKVRNWANEVSRETPPGRVRAATWDELKALVEAGDRMGLPEVSDAVVLSFDLSWSEIDVLNLQHSHIKEGRAFGARQKTGRQGGTPFTFIGLARLEKIRERQKGMKVQSLKVIHLQRQRLKQRQADADSHYFRKLFAQVRAEAAKAVPSVASLTFADLRDTAVTLADEAGLSVEMLASRTRQSRKSMQQLKDKNYGEITPEIADQGRERLEAYLLAKGLNL